ncbi:protein of unknown function DUF4116 containing protein [Nitzschia inconspicua]|uniref:Uncharacterized protein n=1 Tax=Nitzschia inconspicua TaxID=303405 RepID=A0A9K3KI93_9STRA|nr:protein of unknown function DUF4116 containing protein [Nitzschia inconspicua]
MPTTRSQSRTSRHATTTTTTTATASAATKKARIPCHRRPAKKSKKQPQQAAAAAAKRRKLKLMESIDNGKLRWYDLPSKYKKDVEFALCCRHSKKTKWEKTRLYFRAALQVVTDKERLYREWAFAYPEDLRHDPFLWGDSNLWEEAPQQVKSDRQFMKYVVNIYPHLFWVISQNLKDDETFLQELLEQNVATLTFFPESIFRKFTQFLEIRWIRKYCHNVGNEEPLSLSYAGVQIPNEYWQDLDFVRNTWFAAGGTLHYLLPKCVFDDEEMLLTQAKQYYSHPMRKEGHYCQDPEYHCRLSDRLKADKAFLRSLIEIATPGHVRKLLFEYSPYEKDEELVILLFSKKHNRFCEQMEFWRPKIKSKVKEYERFFQGILWGTHINSGSPLSMLDQGKDSNIIKTNIASFLDFPIGNRFVELMRAKEHFGLKRETLFTGETSREKFFYDTSDNSLFFYSESGEAFEPEEDHYAYGHYSSDEYPEYGSSFDDSFDDRSYDY